MEWIRTKDSCEQHSVTDSGIASGALFNGMKIKLAPYRRDAAASAAPESFCQSVDKRQDRTAKRSKQWNACLRVVCVPRGRSGMEWVHIINYQQTIQ